MNDKERLIFITIQLEDDFASYEGMVTVLASGVLSSSASRYNEVPYMRVMKRMSPATRSPMALVRTCQSAGSANGWMQMAGSGWISYC